MSKNKDKDKDKDKAKNVAEDFPPPLKAIANDKAAPPKSPVDDATLSNDNSNNEQTEAPLTSHNETTSKASETDKAGAADTANDNSNKRESFTFKMEQIAQSMSSGAKRKQPQSQSQQSVASGGESTHSSKFDEQSLGAPSQHSLDSYLPEIMKKGGLAAASGGGIGSRLSQHYYDTNHSTALEELPEDLDESAEFAHEEQGDGHHAQEGASIRDNDVETSEVGNQKMSKKSSIASLVKKMNPMKKKSHFAGGQELTDSDEEGEDIDSIGTGGSSGSLMDTSANNDNNQAAIENSYRRNRSRMSKVLKQIVKRTGKKAKGSDGGSDMGDGSSRSMLSGRGSITSESVQSLDILSPDDDEMGPNDNACKSDGEVDPIMVFKFDASDPTVPQFDPLALDTMMMHKSCSEVDRIHQRRSVRSRRSVGVRTTQHKGTHEDHDTTVTKGGVDHLKETSLSNLLSQVDELHSEALLNKKLRDKASARMKRSKNRRTSHSNATGGGAGAEMTSADDDVASVHSTSTNSRRAKSAERNTTSMVDGSLKDHSLTMLSSSRRARSTERNDMADGSVKDHSSIAAASSIAESPSGAKTRQRRRISESPRKSLSTPSNPSRQSRPVGASPMGNSSRQSMGGNSSRRRSLTKAGAAPKVPASLDDADDDN